MQRYNPYSLLLMLTAFLLWGCAHEELTPGNFTVDITLHTARVQTTQTRAISAKSQNVINDLYLLAYDAATRKFLYAKKASNVEDKDADGSTKTASFPFEDSAQLSGLILRFYANVDGHSDVTAKLAAMEANKPELDDPDYRIVSDCSGVWDTTSDTQFAAIPMWGGVVTSTGVRTDAAISLIKGENPSVIVNMMRSMAMVNLVVNGKDGSSTWNGITLHSVKTYNVPTHGYVSALESNLTTKYQVNAPTIDGFTETATRSYTPGDVTSYQNSILLPEADGSGASAPYMVVGLTDGVEVKYIRLDFLDKNDPPLPLNLLRSYNYTFEIKVYKSYGLLGYEIEVQAINAPAENGASSVSIIEDSYHNVMITDESYALYLQDDIVTVPTTGGTASFMIYTTYPDGWKIKTTTLPADMVVYKKDEPETPTYQGIANMNYYLTINVGAHEDRDIVMRVQAGPHLYKDVIIRQQ